MRALDQAYVINSKTEHDVVEILCHLGRVRALLPVQMGPEEEEIMRDSLWYSSSNFVIKYINVTMF